MPRASLGGDVRPGGAITKKDHPQKTAQGDTHLP